MNGKSSFLKGQLWTIVFLVLVVVMGVEILFLVRENKKLREALAGSKGSIKLLNPAEKVPPLVGINLIGEELKIGYPSPQKTLLFWFSPTCPSCEENLGFWREVYQKHNSEKLRILGVTQTGKDKAQEFVGKFQLEFPVLIISDLNILDQYKVEVVPQTMLIDDQGSVLKVWPGPLPGKYKKEIEEMISSFSKT